VSVTPARTKPPVKPVLQTKDIAVCVLLGSRVRTVNLVRTRCSVKYITLAYPAAARIQSTTEELEASNENFTDIFRKKFNRRNR